MRKIELKKATLEVGTELDYKEQLLNMLKFPINQRGIDIPEMMKFLSVGKAVKEATDFLFLEEEQWKILCDRVKEERWKIADQEIVNFVTAITEAQEVPISSAIK